MRPTSSLLILIPLALLLSSCPEARPPVDQVQANVIDKSQLQGEWYFQRTVIDTPYETEFTFIGDQGELERIRWRVEENLLLAVRSYPRFDGSEPAAEDGDAFDGQPVAAWPIQSHFDIRRDYNPVSGEESNVIVENTTDRQWFERDYIRVDWANNVITNWNFYAPNAVELEPMAYAVTDPNDPFAPRIEEDYLEVTSAFFAKPGSEMDPDWGEIPLCWYFYHFDDCTAAEVVVRNSFMKVEERDYEPRRWNGLDMELFGYFDVQRFGYDEQYGPTEPGRIRYQSQWNIWDETHDGRSCTADSDCEDREGSYCSTEVGQCTVPFRDRAVRKIVYYGSPDLDTRFAEVAQEVIDQWNEPMRDTINALRFGECMDDEGDEDFCTSVLDDDIEVFGFCPNNPVREGDPSWCGDEGTAPRLGDLRYNFLYNVLEPGRGNPFGFGPSQLDPLTGEIISAVAIVYEAEIRSYAAWARDLVLLLNGELDEEEFIHGENVAGWVEGRNQTRLEPVTYTPEEVEALTAKVQLRHKNLLPRLGSGESTPAAKLRALRQARQQLSELPAVSADHGRSAARLEALIDSPVEDLLLHDEALLAGAHLPTSALDDSVRDAASPLRRVRNQKHRVARRARMERNSGPRCAYFREFVDPSIEGNAHLYAGVDPEEIRWELMLGIYRGTMAHEMGHTLGLRHNLEGSADPLNYGPNYWALRDDDYAGPRYLDPETSEEIEGRIREEQYSSVMDYLSRFNSDSLGVHSYDKAAIKFGYGRVMEVFTQSDELGSDVANVLYLYQLLGWPPALLYESDTNALVGMHYTEFPWWFGDLDARRDVRQSDLSDYYGNADWFESPHSYLATDFGEPVVPYKFCSDEYAGSGITCLYYDEGADLYEIPLDLAQRYERYYILNNFGRDRLWFNADAYWWRIWDRYFDPMVSLNQWWVLFAQDLYATEEPDDDIDGFLQRYDGFGPFTMGVRETFKSFARTIARPEPGGYVETTDPDGNDSWEPLWWSEDLVVGIDEGRYLAMDWDYDQGYYWDEVIDRVGYFTDKALAMEALFDPTTYFLGQDTASDLRKYRVNYGSNFFEPLMDLVGDVMVGDRSGFAAYNVGGNVVFPDYADWPFSAPPGALPINPNADFTIQLHAMVLGLALLPDTFDSAIIDSTRIWLEGSGDGVMTVRPLVTHTDPESGLTWVAVSYADSGQEVGVAARMVERANNLVALLDAAAAGDDDDSAGDDDDSAGDEDPVDEEELARIDQELRLLRENLNLLRAIHEELGVLAY
ncbi:MAG: zinc-dependent metalloprotease [Myxococcota bacterium]|nr:zinc-dependent metalloprotease [Myxococcota bacterium]